MTTQKLARNHGPKTLNPVVPSYQCEIGWVLLEAKCFQDLGHTSFIREILVLGNMCDLFTKETPDLQAQEVTFFLLYCPP